MSVALDRHDELVGEAIKAHGGYVFSTGGDGFAAAFGRAGEAVAAAVDAQTALRAETWPAGVVVRVRMAVHTGEVVERHGDYFGPAVNLAARLMALAHGGQLLASAVAAQLAGNEVSLLDLGEHRLRDVSATVRVFQVGRGLFPPLRSVDAVPTNLPTQRTALIGRLEEVTRVGKALAEHHLVTLTGVGGVGKTRLALAVAASAAVGYPDGCWLVELAAIRDGTEVPGAVAGALGTTVVDRAALVGYLRGRRLLLVLDNCEHLLGEVASLVDAVLEHGPEVHVLATSREPMGVEGEAVRLVPSLEVPPAGCEVDEARASAAVRLFVERGAAARDGFALDAGNVDSVVDICRHLDGLPLAIELAAARVRNMPPDEIARRLSERFRLLGGGTRRAQERHRTLLAAVAWSHDLLEEADRIVFRRLAVFPASFDLDAAEAVVADGGTDTVEALLRLVDRSLVQFDPGAGRYQLLETLRQFGADRLAEAAETETAADRHAGYFLELAADQGGRMLAPTYPQARAALTRELDNLRTAAEWCAEQARWEELLGLAAATWPYAILSSGHDHASWYRRVVASHPDLSRQERVDALGRLAFLTVLVLPDFVEAEKLADESERSSASPDCLVSPWAAAAHALVQLFTGRYEDCLQNGRAALTAAEIAQDDLASIVVLGGQANALAAVGQLDEAERVALEALTRSEEMGCQGAITTSAIAAAGMQTARADGADFSAGLDVLARHGHSLADDDAHTMWILLVTGFCFLGLHDPAAGQNLIQSARLADRLNIPMGGVTAIQGLGLHLARHAQWEAAARLAGYVDTQLAILRIDNHQWRWVHEELNSDLVSYQGAEAARAEGARMERREIMNLLNRLEARPR